MILDTIFTALLLVCLQCCGVRPEWQCYLLLRPWSPLVWAAYFVTSDQWVCSGDTFYWSQHETWSNNNQCWPVESSGDHCQDNHQSWWWVRLKSCLTCKNRFKLYVTFNYQRTKTKIEFPYLLQRFAGSEQEWSEQIVGAILCIGVQERCFES